MARAGRADAAREDLDAALALARDVPLPRIGLASLAHLATLPGGDAHAVLAALAAHGERTEMQTRMHARLVLWHAAWLYDGGRPCGREGAIAKVLASEAAKKAALACLQIHGGSGYTMELDVQRYVRDALLLTIGGGTTQIQRNVIARHLGLRPG